MFASHLHRVWLMFTLPLHLSAMRGSRCCASIRGLSLLGIPKRKKNHWYYKGQLTSSKGFSVPACLCSCSGSTCFTCSHIIHFSSCFMRSWILFLSDSLLFPPLIPSVTHSAFPPRSVCLFWINNIQLFCPQSSVPFKLFSLHDNFLLFSFKMLPESCEKVCCKEKKE